MAASLDWYDARSPQQPAAPTAPKPAPPAPPAPAPKSGMKLTVAPKAAPKPASAKARPRATEAPKPAATKAKAPTPPEVAAPVSSCSDGWGDLDAEMSEPEHCAAEPEQQKLPSSASEAPSRDKDPSAIAAAQTAAERAPPASTPSQPAPATRALDVHEVDRTVHAAVAAKEALARESISKAKEELLAKKRLMEVRRLEEERQLREAAAQLEALEGELQNGCSKSSQLRIQELRKAIEAAGKDIALLQRDVAAKREAMRSATEAYVCAEERMARRREARQVLEQEMLELILSAGKAKDEHLTQVLSSVPVS